MRRFPGASMAPASFMCVGLCVWLLAAGPAGAGTDVTAKRPESETPSARSARRALPPTFEQLRAQLDRSDRIAALTALQMALDQVGDGGTFYWRKPDRNLKGIIKPTAAFRNADGRVCRHVIYALSLGAYRKQIEIVACREAGGRWRL